MHLQGYSIHLNGNQPLEKYFSLDEVRGGVTGFRLLLILSGVMKYQTNYTSQLHVVLYACGQVLKPETPKHIYRCVLWGFFVIG